MHLFIVNEARVVVSVCRTRCWKTRTFGSRCSMNSLTTKQQPLGTRAPSTLLSTNQSRGTSGTQLVTPGAAQKSLRIGHGCVPEFKSAVRRRNGKGSPEKKAPSPKEQPEKSTSKPKAESVEGTDLRDSKRCKVCGIGRMRVYTVKKTGRLVIRNRKCTNEECGATDKTVEENPHWTLKKKRLR